MTKEESAQNNLNTFELAEKTLKRTKRLIIELDEIKNSFMDTMDKFLTETNSTIDNLSLSPIDI